MQKTTEARFYTTDPPQVASSHPDLTEREQTVLHLMAQGMNNPEIAHALAVSRSTIKFHVSNILAKLHTATRTGAVSIASRSANPSRHARNNAGDGSTAT